MLLDNPPLSTATQLSAFVEAQALARGFRQITLGVRLQLPENTTFYTKLGYDIVGYGSHLPESGVPLASASHLKGI